MIAIIKPVTFKSLLLTATILAAPLIAITPTPASAQVVLGVAIQIAPPLLPVYVQPPMPEVGHMWTPRVRGLWDGWLLLGTGHLDPATDDRRAIDSAVFGLGRGAYVFNGGYWGPHVGFYGGVNYSYGHGGSGYQGGRWNGGNFTYNRSANNFGSVSVQNTYQQNLTVNNHTNISYVGGADGLKGRTDRSGTHGRERAAHTATAEQTKLVTAAASNPALAASHNNGHPAITTTSRPTEVGAAGLVHPTSAGTAQHVARPATVAHSAERAAKPTAVAHPWAQARPEGHEALRCLLGALRRPPERPRKWKGHRESLNGLDARPI